MKKYVIENEITLVKLASKIAKIEGRKHEASIGDVREILRILSDMIAGELAAGGDKEGVSSIEACLWEDSRRRYEKLIKKKKKMN